MKISSAVLEELYLHAEETYPDECCGFLLGPKDGAEADELLRCENRQDELHASDPERYPRTARTAYTLSGKDVLFLDRSQKSERPVRVLYHSHNDTGAYFSAEDKAFALFAGEPAYPVDYLVVDVQGGRAREARLFRYSAERADFVEAQVYSRA
jgi:proteasome lid subunit RPN8/RPN11